MAERTEDHFPSENEGILEIQNGSQVLNMVLSGRNEKKRKDLFIQLIRLLDEKGLQKICQTFYIFFIILVDFQKK